MTWHKYNYRINDYKTLTKKCKWKSNYELTSSKTLINHNHQSDIMKTSLNEWRRRYRKAGRSLRKSISKRSTKWQANSWGFSMYPLQTKCILKAPRRSKIGKFIFKVSEICQNTRIWLTRLYNCHKVKKMVQ